MSVTIFKDVEEALSREVRRISFHESRTVDKVVMEDTFDPFTGEIISTPVEPSFYDSSADANNIQYPHFFLRLLRTRHDRFTNRVVPPYGKWCRTPVNNSPKAFEIIVSSADGLINSAGNELVTTIFQINKVKPGFLLRMLSGNNKGTYIIDSINASGSGNHSIFVSSTLVENLPDFEFDNNSRIVIFNEGVDLSTIEVGDIFEDASSNTFNITAVDADAGTVTIDGVTNPDTNSDSKITRSGNIFKTTDLSFARFIVMDPSKPVTVPTVSGPQQASAATVGVSPEIPLDLYYLVRIDSKTRENHIATLNRVWEEFNPPRTALPVIKRTKLSADELLTEDVASGGSSTIKVNTTNLNVGDKVFIFNDLTPTKKVNGEGFQTPFESKVKSIVSTTEVELEDVVPDSFKLENCARIVSNAEFRLFMFHFVDHVTKDIEGAQYWVHEFTFWVQVWINRLEEPETLSTITDIATQMEDSDSNIIIEDS